MLQTLADIFNTNSIEKPTGAQQPLHSHTSKEQGLFLQKIFDEIKPKKSVEVGLAYGISTMFILEKHRQQNSPAGSHIVIEPDRVTWEGVAEHNIEKEALTQYCDYHYDFSDKVLPQLYLQNQRIQFAYVDTTKVFDIVLQDFYFINKILDVGGVIVLDDCGGYWPGVQKVARFISSLPHYKIYGQHKQVDKSSKQKLADKITKSILTALPFMQRRFPAYSFKTDHELGIDYACMAFQKIAEDKRNWDWDERL